MIQFYAPDIATDTTLPESDSQHCVRVLRMREGDPVQAVDGRGLRYRCRIAIAHPKRTLLHVESVEEQLRVWPADISVAVAPTKHSDRIEWLVEKLVEIGNGKGLITTDLVVSLEAVRKLVYTPEIFAIELDINGDKRMAVLKDIQFHPVKDTILHIDLLEVNENKPVVMEVPVKLEGHAEGVKAGGKLSLVMKKLRVKALYTAIPERLVLNVDHLGLGKTMQVGEIHIDGLELVNAKNAVVCAVQLTRAARGAAAAAAAGK